MSGIVPEEKLGYLPQKELLKVTALDHRALMSEWLFFKVLIYYGGKIIDKAPDKERNIEYSGMFRFLDASTYIDPYNIDSYYIAQAVFAWELGRIRDVNFLLERGAMHRTWDYNLSFFLGFNNYYFLKDYKSAAMYMEQAARISRFPLAINLTARFLHESNETATAILFLRFMIEKTWNEKVKHILETRLKALEAIHLLEKGIKIFESRYHKSPLTIGELVDKGIIDSLPEDPYGGVFYIGRQGRIESTSRFTFRYGHESGNKDRKPHKNL